VIAAIVFSASAIYLYLSAKNQRRVAPSLLGFGTFFLIGALTIQIQGHRGDSQIWLGNGEEVTVTAHVISEGDIQSDGPGSLHQRVDVKTEIIEIGGQVRETHAGIRLSVYSQAKLNAQTQGAIPLNISAANGMQLLRYGQRIRFHATLTPPRNYRNPGAFDYAGYLREQGIVATSSTKFSGIEVLPGFFGSRIGAWRAGMHRSIIEKIHVLWPERVAGLMDAIVIGEETFIDRPTRVDFQRSGTYHVLVVSGMNVSILAMSTLWMLRRFGLGEIAASAAAITLILGYAALTKEGSPVWRAALMFAVYLATRLLYRDRAMLNTLGAAALALLIADPNVLFGASFQMTFLCVGLVAGVGVPVLERTIEPFSRGLRNLDALAYDRSLSPRVAQFRIDLRLVLNRVQLIMPGKAPAILLVTTLRGFLAFCELMIISAILQLGLAAPMAYYFHRATSVALPANLLVIPFLQLLMPAAVLAIASSYISPWLAKVPAAIAGLALEGIAGTVKALGGLRLADIRVPTPSVAAIVFAGFAIVICAVLIRRRPWFALAGAGVLAVSGVWIWALPYRLPYHPQIRGRGLEMTAIDVGQGDSIFLGMPDGSTVLVDAGGLPFWTHSQLDIGEDVVSPYLWSRGISRIGAIALTHAHADHMGGMPAVMANFRPRELWLPEGIPSDEISNLLDEARELDVSVIYRKAGDVFSFGGAQIRVLAPVPGAMPSVRSSLVGSGKGEQHRNDESLVIKVSYGKTSALLEADAEKPAEKFISTEDPGADVLKVAHHGSASSTNNDLLSVVRPHFAIISVGVRNVYHHPRPEVLQRLQQAKVLTYRTDMDGATSFYLDGKNVTSRAANFP
jgi:competence protein ComEC